MQECYRLSLDLVLSGEDPASEDGQRLSKVVDALYQVQRGPYNKHSRPLSGPLHPDQTVMIDSYTARPSYMAMIKSRFYALGHRVRFAHAAGAVALGAPASPDRSDVHSLQRHVPLEQSRRSLPPYCGALELPFRAWELASSLCIEFHSIHDLYAKLCISIGCVARSVGMLPMTGHAARSAP